jgi:type IV secretion system protein VirB11
LNALASRAEIERRLIAAMRQQLGLDVCARLEDPAVVEIMLNPDGRLWEDRLGAGMRPIGTMEATNAESLISIVASTLRASVTRESPILECELPIRGARFEAMVPPLSAAPVFTIRLLAVRVFTLADYVDDGIMTSAQRGVLEEAAADRRNVLISGGTGSGKTTLVNAVLHAQAQATPHDRFVILEDTVELRCPAENVVALKATGNVDMQRLLRATMRLRPDRIVIGEVRGGEALSMIKAWNTGHEGGVCTLHANSGRAALTRLERLIAEATSADIRADIAEAVHFVIHITKTKTSRVISPILKVNGFQNGDYVIQPLEV